MPGKRIRHGNGRAAQHVDQVLLFGAKMRLLFEKRMQALEHPGIARVSDKAFVAEQRLEGFEGRVAVGHPEHEHFFQRNGAVRSSVRFGLQVFLRVELALVNCYRGKIGGKAQ